MRELDGALRTGGRTDAASLADGIYNLGLELAAENLFLDGLERAAAYALAAGNAASGIDVGNLRVVFQLVA